MTVCNKCPPVSDFLTESANALISKCLNSNSGCFFARFSSTQGGNLRHIASKTILFKACLFNLTFHKGSHSKGLKQKSTACASKKSKTFHRKVFWATFHGSTNLFEKYGAYLKNTLQQLSRTCRVKRSNIDVPRMSDRPLLQHFSIETAKRYMEGFLFQRVALKC